MSAIGSSAGIVSHSNAKAQLAQQVSVAVAGKVQDAVKAEGQAVMALLDSAASVAPHGSVESGKGDKIDVHG